MNRIWYSTNKRKIQGEIPFYFIMISNFPIDDNYVEM